MTYTGSENAPGGASWVTRGEDEACVDDQGLQAFEGYTNYWTESANPEAWFLVDTTVSENILTARTTTSRAQALASSPSAGEWTVSCTLAAGASSQSRLRIYQEGGSGGQYCAITLTSEAKRFHCTSTVGGTPTLVAGMLYITDGTTDTGSILAHQCQLTRTPLPMPRHDCGPSPCSRAGEVHTVSTEGWPRSTVARYDLQVTLPASDPVSVSVLDTRGDDGGGGLRLYWNSSGLLVAGAYGPGGAILGAAGSVAAWPAGTHSLSVRLGGGRIGIYRDGAMLYDASLAAGTVAHGPRAHLGSSSAGGLHLNGHIRLLRVSTP